GAQAKRNDKVTAELFLGKDARSASDALLEKALVQADDGSWERIAVAQMYYLSGRRERGEALMHGIRKKKASDWMRIGRVYFRSGEWEKAEEAFDRVIEMDPEDEDRLAEIGSYYNLQGDRAKAEELFVRAFELDADDLYNTLRAAGSYIGIEHR
ncbi:MAG: tetratricopeptide repeat protein, partial [Holophagales bacterium]|nr:tetratricopeptide repeat protein [Holophagales bacterium]